MMSGDHDIVIEIQALEVKSRSAGACFKWGGDLTSPAIEMLESSGDESQDSADLPADDNFSLDCR